MSSSTLSTSFRQAYLSGRLSQNLLLLACSAGIVGLFAARALVALSPVVGVLAAAANPNWRNELQRWGRNQSVLLLAALYALLLVSGLYTTNWAVWRHEVYRELPLLGVPLAFAVAVPLSGRQRFGLGCSFVISATLLGVDTMVRYLVNAREIHDMFSTGQNMQTITGIFHIHFGIMLALAFYFGVFLWRSSYATLVWRWILGIAVILLALSLHMLAYRTGLVAFYIALLFDALSLLVTRRRFIWGLVLLALFVGGPLAAYQWLDTVRERVNGTRYDIEQFYNGTDINDLSLSRRMAAWETARTIVLQHPWVGVGLGDAETAMMNQYAWRDFGLLPVNRVMIHNQYLHYLLGSGVVGLFVWLLVLLGPLAQPTVRRNPYVIHFLLILSVAMLADSLLQLQISFNLFVFLYGFLVVDTERRAQLTADKPA